MFFLIMKSSVLFCFFFSLSVGIFRCLVVDVVLFCFFLSFSPWFLGLSALKLK